ncbi:MAG: PQQ-binding-like beta-propeller repeat protein [Fibromonadales bacterium]|nr:PQQ-binding-like beta-propeller repeat protein [Fibromonadales bacterium]
MKKIILSGIFLAAIAAVAQQSAPWELFKPSKLPQTDPATNLGYKHETQINGELGQVHFEMPDSYTNLGLTTWRGNNFRNRTSLGTAEVAAESLVVRYSMNIGSIGDWSGVGWSGQPAIVKWDFALQQKMNLLPGKREKEELVEVIYGTLDGKIYFFDLEDGKQTRKPIVLGSPIKGGITIDPRGYPILYVGQGIPEKGSGKIGYHIFSLVNGSKLFFLNGKDAFAMRNWGAFDANPLIDVVNDRLILAGENGVVYNILLNTKFDGEAGTVAIDPVISRYRYSTNPIRRWFGMEGSVSAFSHYLFFADNSGIVQCVDLRTFEPVWIHDATDDTDAATVLDWEAEHERLALYVGSEVDLQGEGGSSYIRKLNAANGDVLWEHSYKCQFHSTNGGLLATPVIGQGDISKLVIFFIAKVLGKGGGGLLVAYDRESGNVVWENALPNYGWSSPVAVYTPDGKSYLIVSDSVGNMYLIKGADGKVVRKINLGSNIEASAVAYKNMLVIGTRGNKIFGIEIK